VTGADSVVAATRDLLAAGAAAGLHADAVTDEGATLAAALCETADGASSAWAEAFGRPAASFPSHAVAGRDWRRHPTPLLRRLVEHGPREAAAAYAQALAAVASASCSLGDPTLRVIDVATFAAQAQLRAAGIEPAPLDQLTALVGGPGAAGPPATTPDASAATTPGASAATTPGAAGSSPTASGAGTVAAGPPAPGGTAAAGGAAAPATPGAPANDPPPPRTLESLLEELDGLVGLDRVKSEVRRQAEVLRVAKLRSTKGLKRPEITRHLVFVGNPGTGKTTVARLVAGIYHALGVLPKGQLVECDRAGLVAGYVGQTAIKTSQLAGTAHGGVLFIDEAYSLASDDFGREAIDTLVKEMEDHREDLIVIVAGYPELMAEFISTNPGLESRFRLTLEFDDYSDDDLVTIFERVAAAADFSPTAECVAALRSLLAATPRDEGFGNGRFVRNLFEAGVVRQAWRLRDVAEPTVEQLRALSPDDLRTDDQAEPPPLPAARTGPPSPADATVNPADAAVDP
jgi:Holliday junction resolvasome RuvABC ATP-dependent DNA helicase subunit